MQVFVTLPSGNTLAFNVDANETIGSIKTQIQKHEGIHIDQQQLQFGGMELENNKTLEHYKISSYSWLHLTVQPSKKRPAQGQSISLEVDGSYTISELKKMISERAGIPIDKQELLFGGEHLDDNSKTISQYNIRKDSTVFLLIRMKKRRRKK